MHDRFKKSDYIGGKLFLNIVHFKRQILQCESLFFLIKGFSLCLLKHKTVSSWTSICKIYWTSNFLSHRQSQVKYVKQFTSKIRRLIWYYCIGLVLLHRFQIYCKTILPFRFAVGSSYLPSNGRSTTLWQKGRAS